MKQVGQRVQSRAGSLWSAVKAGSGTPEGAARFLARENITCAVDKVQNLVKPHKDMMLEDESRLQ